MDHYEVLGVRADASGVEIRRAYLRLARRHHPDFHAGDRDTQRQAAEHRMRELNRAWAVLGDPERRRAYDRSLAAPPAGDAPESWVPGTVTPGFQPLDPEPDPDDPAAPFDVPYGEDPTVPRVLQVLPVLLAALAVLALGAGALLAFGPLLQLGLAAAVATIVSLLLAPVVAVFRSQADERR